MLSILEDHFHQSRKSTRIMTNVGSSILIWLYVALLLQPGHSSSLVSDMVCHVKRLLTPPTVDVAVWFQLRKGERWRRTSLLRRYNVLFLKPQCQDYTQFHLGYWIPETLPNTPFGLILLTRRLFEARVVFSSRFIAWVALLWRLRDLWLQISQESAQLLSWHGTTHALRCALCHMGWGHGQSLRYPCEG